MNIYELELPEFYCVAHNTPNKIMNSFSEELSSTHDLTDIHLCRFCNEKSSPLVILCNCTSNVGYVHEKCALQWMSLRLETNEGSNVRIPACQLCQCPLSAEVRVGKRVINKQMLWYSIKQIGPLNAFLFLVILVGTILAPYLIGKTIIDILYHEVENLFATVMGKIIFPLHCFYWGGNLIYQSSKIVSQCKMQLVEITLVPKETLK